MDDIEINEHNVWIRPGSAGEIFLSNYDLDEYKYGLNRNIELEILRAASKANMWAEAEQELTGTRFMWHPNRKNRNRRRAA